MPSQAADDDVEGAVGETFVYRSDPRSNNTCIIALGTWSQLLGFATSTGVAEALAPGGAAVGRVVPLKVVVVLGYG